MIEHKIKGKIARKAGVGEVYEKMHTAKVWKKRIGGAVNKLKPKLSFTEQVKKARELNARGKAKVKEKVTKKTAEKEVKEEEGLVSKLKIHPKLPYAFVQKVRKGLNEIYFQIMGSKLSAEQKKAETEILDITASAILEHMMPLEAYREELIQRGYPPEIVERWTKIFLELVK